MPEFQDSRVIGSKIGGRWGFHEGQLENRLIFPPEMIGSGPAVVKKRERVGGLLNYYYREAA